MDREMIEQKLESLRRSIHRIQSRCPDHLEALQTSVDAQDIVTLNLTRAVQLAVDIGSHVLSRLEQPVPATMGDTFSQLAAQGLISPELSDRLKRAVGFRNIAVHNYEAIDWGIVFVIVQDRLSDFTEYARAVVDWLGKAE
jgi:uncharacterized protein YutE (UPF0331/DUF86 family)